MNKKDYKINTMNMKLQILSYNVHIEQDEDGIYYAIFPDLPGCFSCGDTFEETKANIQEAMECHLESIIEDDDPFPYPQDLSTDSSSITIQVSIPA